MFLAALLLTAQYWKTKQNKNISGLRQGGGGCPLSWKRRDVFGDMYQRKNNKLGNGLSMTWETQDEEMPPEFEARSLAEEWHNPFRWEV